MHGCCGMRKIIIAGFIVVLYIIEFGLMKVASDYDDAMEELMKEGENNECKGLSETAKEAG